ncbi:MAG: hypothetical protein KC535_02320 [Nanoarchaeota archaeon]|nr:hypothetical protein [Nanoarchaeota archaeon]
MSQQNYSSLERFLGEYLARTAGVVIHYPEDFGDLVMEKKIRENVSIDTTHSFWPILKGYQQLIKEVSSEEVDFVIIKEISAFSREGHLLCDYYQSRSL